MSSGIAVADDVVQRYEAMKLGKAKLRYMLLKINADKTEIAIVEENEKGADDNEGTYEEFLGKLPPVEGMYAIYDFKFTTLDGRPQEKIMFLTW